MPINEIIRIKEYGDKKAIQTLLFVVNCALVLRKRVVANVLTVKSSEVDDIKNMLKNTGISLLYLYIRNDKVILYLYRKEELSKNLKDKRIRKFLKQYGYHSDDINCILAKLVARFKEYESNNKGFPHEIGVFFGYPLEDVESYIKYNGKNALLVGYWKVYHNLDESKKIFKVFDEEKSKAVWDLINGKTVYEIAS